MYIARQLRRLSGLMAVILVLAACSSTTDNTQTTNAPADGTEAPEADPEGETDDDSSSSEGDTVDELIVAIGGDIDNFDAHTAQLIVYQFAVKTPVFSSLVNYDENLEIQPDLAVDWEVNDDATEFQFTLAEDAVFHDGEPVTTEDVVENFDRLREADSVWSPRVENIADVEIVSDTEMIVTLDQPAANFLDDLTAVSIIAPSSFEEADTNPVGSGPYRFVEWSANEHIIVERNPDYFGPQPTVERLEFRPIPDEQVAFVNLQAGDVDIIVSAGNTTVQQAESQGFPVVRPAYTTAMVLAELGGTTGALDDVRIRRALAHALDRDTINEIEYDGAAEMVEAPLPSGFWAYAPQDGYEYDLDRARELLEEAGAQDLELQVEVLAGRAWAETTARVWQESLAEIGVDLNINVSEVSVWLDAYTTRNYDLILNNFPPAEPHVFFNLGLRPHLDEEDNWYDRPDILELIDSAIATPDMDERAEIYAELQAHVMEELPVLPMFTLPLASVTAEDISGYRLDPRGWALFDQVTRG